MPDLSQINPFGALKLGSLGMGLLVFAISVVVMGLIGWGIYIWIQRKKLKYTIVHQKKVGNQTMKIGQYKARDFSISRAGDKLWYIPKIKKFIPCGVFQSAPNEYTYFEREDGEFINVQYPDVDEKMKQMGVKFVNQDMRAVRVAIGDLLDSRFKDKKSWWEKYGHLVTHLIFYVVVCICMVVIFYQFTQILDKMSFFVDRLIKLEDKMDKSGNQGVVPAIIMLFYWKIKTKVKK